MLFFFWGGGEGIGGGEGGVRVLVVGRGGEGIGGGEEEG